MVILKKRGLIHKTVKRKINTTCSHVKNISKDVYKLGIRQ